MSDKSFYEYVMDEIFHEIPGISSRAMFGGWGFYKEGVFFALIADNELYFKVDEDNKKDYEDLGSEPFIYKSKKGLMTMSYWVLPEEIRDDRGKLEEWIGKSVMAGIKSKKKK